MKLLFILALGLAAVSAVPFKSQRIVGGSIASIGQYPHAVALLFSPTGVNFGQQCVGSIINNRSILSAAHCFNPTQTINWRGRVGSTNASSGGVVHTIQLIINHPLFNRFTNDNDISVLRVASTFGFNVNVRAGSIAGPNFFVPDNAVVWAIGWGTIYFGGPLSEQLRHVQVWVVNQAVCRQRYAEIQTVITDNMLCSGWLDVGGRDQCTADSGGPLLQNNVIVGVSSFGYSCGHPRFPGVNTRVSRYTTWIQSNA